MGMYVCGRNPTGEVGQYFRRNVWGWRPIADFIIETRPEIAKKCRHWHSNDGAGLNAKDAVRLADELDAMIADGSAQAYVDIRDASLKELPNEECEYCGGTGIRADEFGREHGMTEKVIDEPGHPRHGEKGWCNGCGGKGWERPFATHYGMDLDDIREFSAFARASGGFEIC